jgi:Tfp pilus assembly protein PilF
MSSKESRINAHLQMGTAFLEVGDNNSALAEFSKAELLEPNNLDVIANLAQTYFRRGDLPEAVTRYQKVLALDPTRTEAHNNLGLVYLRQRDFAKAREEFNICLKDPTYSQVHLAQFNLGLLEESEGHLDKAADIYLQVIAAREMPEAYFRLGRLAADRGDTRGAVDYYLTTVRLSPRYADAFYALAESYEKLDMKDEAAEAYGQVITLNPNTARAIEAQTRVRRLLGYQ